jgi:hypothetical protein
VPGTFSIYKMNNLQVNSENNKIRNCSAQNGAIYKLTNTDFTDVGSIFENNGADKGGVAYCYMCKMHFIGTTFSGNYAN